MDLNTTPIHEFTIDVIDYDETDTGINAFGRDVYQGDITFNDEAFTLTADITYWLALQMDSPDNVFHANCDYVIGDYYWWFGDAGIWESNPCGCHSEGCYAFYGDTLGISSASLGQIKASYR